MSGWVENIRRSKLTEGAQNNSSLLIKRMSWLHVGNIIFYHEVSDNEALLLAAYLQAFSTDTEDLHLLRCQDCNEVRHVPPSLEHWQSVQDLAASHLDSISVLYSFEAMESTQNRPLRVLMWSMAAQFIDFSQQVGEMNETQMELRPQSYGKLLYAAQTENAGMVEGIYAISHRVNTTATNLTLMP